MKYASVFDIFQPGYHDSEHHIDLALLPQLRLTHPIRLHPAPLQATISSPNNLPLLRLFASEVQISEHALYPFISSIYLQSSDVCIFAILVILHDSYLDKECSESLAIFSTSYMIERNVDPAFRLCEFEGRERDEVVVACAS